MIPAHTQAEEPTDRPGGWTRSMERIIEEQT